MLAVVSLIVLVVPSLSAGADDNGRTINVAYDFPIKPGSEEWADIQSHADRALACQIPEDILGKMTTEALIETVLDYPFYMDLYFFNNYQNGFETMSSRFNAFQELLTREDLGGKLIARYSMMDPTDINESGMLNGKRFNSFSFADIEILLSQDEVLEKLNEGQLQALNQLVYQKHEDKKNVEEFSGCLDYYVSSVLALATTSYSARFG